MDVMEPDVPRKPPENFGQLGVGATEHRGVKGSPFVLLCPMPWVKLMLDAQKPHTDNPGQEQIRQMNEKEDPIHLNNQLQGRNRQRQVSSTIH